MSNSKVENNSSISPSTNVVEEKEMSFLDHLEELRWHIIKSLIAIIVIAIGVFLAKTFVFETIIFGPKRADFVTYRFLCGISETLCLQPPDFELITRELGEQFIVHLKVSFWLGLIIAFPYVFYQFWSFIRPGLYDHEQKATRGTVTICSILFLMGIMFGYYIVSPFAVTFLSSYDVGATSAPTLQSFVNYMTMFTIPTGIIFELPILVFFLSKIGMITPEFMRTYRKHAIIVMLILASIITPPDVTTQILISLPLFILYEISIFISARVQKKKKFRRCLEFLQVQHCFLNYSYLRFGWSFLVASHCSSFCLTMWTCL